MIVPSRELMPVIRAALERGQHVRMTVTGGSMWPFIRDGDIVELEPLSTSPAQGDIVLAQPSAEHYVVHRVVRVQGESVWLRGDAQRHCEGPVQPHDILGRITRSHHHGRPRALDHGAWRFAGLMWVHCTPLGLWLSRLASGIGTRALRRL
jgi:hypothetical protein